MAIKFRCLCVSTYDKLENNDVVVSQVYSERLVAIELTVLKAYDWYNKVQENENSTIRQSCKKLVESEEFTKKQQK